MPKNNEIIIKLNSEGKKASEIARLIGSNKRRVNRILKKLR
jgi:hypothetical protein